MSSRRVIGVLAVCAALLVVCACASQQPESVAKLQVFAPCSYALDGLAATIDELPEALRLAKERHRSSRVRFVLSPGVQYECLHAAIAVAGRVGADIGITGSVVP